MLRLPSSAMILLVGACGGAHAGESSRMSTANALGGEGLQEHGEDGSRDEAAPESGIEQADGSMVLAAGQEVDGPSEEEANGSESSPEAMTEKLVLEFSRGVDPRKLYNEKDLQDLLPKLKWELFSQLMKAGGYLSWDINRDSEKPIKCDAEELRKVSLCSRDLIQYLQTYQRYLGNAWYPPTWTKESDVSVLSFGAGYEMKFDGSPLMLREIVYSYRE